MLIKMMEHLQKAKTLSKPYKGIVVDDQDPLQLRRVRVIVEGLIVGPFERLPWVSRWTPKGGSPGDMDSWTPTIGSEVVVEFKYEDIYSPFYTGAWISAINNPNAMGEDYPNTTGQRDESGNSLSVNKAKGVTEYTHQSGSSVKFTQDGEIIITPKGKLRFQSPDGQSSYSLDFKTGKLETTLAEGNTLGGKSTIIESAALGIRVEEVDESITGSKNSSIEGTQKTNIGGAKSETILSNYSQVVAGKTTKMFTDKTTETYGAGKETTVGLGDLIEKLIAGNREIILTLGNMKYQLIAGNYQVDIIAGNVLLNTAVGKVNISNTLATIELTQTGALNVTTITGATFTDAAMITLAAPLVKLGPAIAPVLTLDMCPIVDNISGSPHIARPTVLA